MTQTSHIHNESSVVAAAQPKAVKARQGKHEKRNNWLYIIAIPVLLIMVLPYIYLLLQSFAAWDQVNNTFIPTSFTLRSYEWIWTGGGFTPQPWLSALFNSTLVTTVDSVCMVAFGAIVGYALSVLEFKGRRIVNNFILFQMFYPAIILLVPTFLVIRFAGLYDTYWAMLIPKALSLWAIFMYTNFFGSIDKEVIEAARMDGASEIGIIFRIMLPISRSITSIIFLFVFMERWTELMWDLIVVKDTTKQTLNVLLSTMFGPYGSYPGPLYAAATLLTFPILILFILFSRNFVKGVQFVLR
ncbi:sugar ABC transporter permease [Dictyobacter alpinus]|uniref:Sugar ABC transporter permease n=2 Tax=Dictyobacter alpinus TaxID=2014873 RepID=A0A402BGU3_9CHLR|nr:carbohydrate ABC transporter permease [Dictyobacter alpinus]GCE30593.1 sugar ABC transporter permease [Dictyobacter alpinus]